MCLRIKFCIHRQKLCSIVKIPAMHSSSGTCQATALVSHWLVDLAQFYAKDRKNYQQPHTLLVGYLQHANQLSRLKLGIITKNQRCEEKNLFRIAVYVLTYSYSPNPTIPLSGRSNLARQPL
jgi:hypothetical protein